MGEFWIKLWFEYIVICLLIFIEYENRLSIVILYYQLQAVL